MQEYNASINHVTYEASFHWNKDPPAHGHVSKQTELPQKKI